MQNISIFNIIQFVSESVRISLIFTRQNFAHSNYLKDKITKAITRLTFAFEFFFNNGWIHFVGFCDFYVFVYFIFLLPWRDGGWRPPAGRVKACWWSPAAGGSPLRTESREKFVKTSKRTISKKKHWRTISKKTLKNSLQENIEEQLTS